MSGSLLNAKAAVEAMLAAGAIFVAKQSANGIGISFAYRVAPGGDMAGCRSIMDDIKARPAAFRRAFQCEIAALVGTGGAT